MDKPLVVVVAGPTASGKTNLGIEIAKHFDGEIVSADSMQIYKNMDIATAKPNENELAQAKHYLIGFLDPDESFSVAKYKELAIGTIDNILKRGKLPIVVGGTGLYIDTLVKNTEFFDYEKSDVREKLEERLKNEGIEVLLSELQQVDPISAEKLHTNDVKRIIRALEVYYITGETITRQCELSHLNESKYRFCTIGLTAENRQYLYDRINKRVDLMLQEGLIEEAKAFFSQSYGSTAKQAIGYKELKPYLDGLVTLDEAVEKLKMETRRYAKRQLTWFRRNDKIHWLTIDTQDSDKLCEAAFNIISEER